MKNLRVAVPAKFPKEDRKLKALQLENVTVKFSKEEIELIKKGLHLEEMSICEILNDDIIKYQHQLSVIKNLYDKLDAA
jgi:hypothetical protein